LHATARACRSSPGDPLDPSLRGGALFAQAFVLDPMGPWAGLASSTGRRLAFGD
jgi:hypothetical protein